MIGEVMEEDPQPLSTNEFMNVDESNSLNIEHQMNKNP